MIMAIAISVSLLIGISLGALLHSQIVKQASASKAELFGWAQELRAVAITDAQAAKTKIDALIAKIENKL